MDAQNRLVVEVAVENVDAAEANVERFERTVKEAGREIEKLGKGTSFGEDYARQTERAASATARVEDAVRNVGQAAPKGTFDDFLRGADKAERVANELDKAIEDSFKKSRASATGVSDQFVRQLESTQRQLLSLHGTFGRLEKSPLKSVADDGARASAHAYQMQQTLGSLYRQLERGRPLSELNKELDQANLKVERLRQQAVRLQSSHITGGGGSRPPARSAVNDLGLTGQQREGIERTSGILGRITGAGDLFTTASVARYGGAFASLGVAGLAGAGLQKSIQLSMEAEKAQLALAVAVRDAGGSFTKATADAETFARALNTTRGEASLVAGAMADLHLHTGGAFQNRADLAGQLGTIAEARGLEAEKAADLIQRIGRGDKAAFEQFTGYSADLALDRYAKSVNTTTERLTEMERAQVLVNEAQRHYGEFTDLAERRTNSFEGKLKSTKSGIKDFAAEYGRAFVARFINLETSEATYERVLREQEEDAKRGRATQDAKQREQTEIDRREKLRLQEQHFFQDFSYQSSLERRTPAEQLRAALEEQGRFQQNFQQFSAEDQQGFTRQFHGLVTGLKQTVSQNRISDALTQIGREENLQARIEGIRRLRSEIEEFAKSGALAPDQAIDKLRSLDEQIYQTQKQIEQAVRSARKDASEFLSDFAARTTGGSNPFISLFDRAETAAERMQERFKALGSEAVRQFTEMERRAVNFEISTQRLSHSLRAVELEFQSEQLLKPFVGITAEQQRQLGLLQRRFDALTNAPDLRRQAEAFERGFDSQNDFQQRREQLEEYERVKRLRPQGSDEAARAAQKIIDDFILERTKNLTVDARFSADPLTRQQAADRAGALNARAARFEAEIQDEIRRAEASRANVELANRKLEELARSAPGLGEDTLRKEFLAITQALDPKELSGEIRQAMALALRDEAQHERQLEQEARDFRAQLVGPGGILLQIKDAIVGQQTAAQGAPAGEEAGDVVRITSRMYPSKEAYEAEMLRRAEEERRGIAEFERRQFGDGAAGVGAAGVGARDYARVTSAPAADVSGGLSLDEKIFAFVRAQMEGRVFGDPAGLLPFERVGAPVEVNRFSQDFFRARPGYSPHNDPREFDASDPYQEAFFRAGYLNSLQGPGGGAGRPREETDRRAEAGEKEKIDVLKQILAALSGGRGHVTIEVLDHSSEARVSILGAAYQ